MGYQMILYAERKRRKEKDAIPDIKGEQKKGGGGEGMIWNKRRVLRPKDTGIQQEKKKKNKPRKTSRLVSSRPC